MGKKKFAVHVEGEPLQTVYADRHKLRGDCGASFFNEVMPGEGALELVADFPKVVGVVQDLLYVPPASGVRDAAVATLGVASLRRFGSPLSEAIESAALLVADLEQVSFPGPNHLSVLGRMSAHLNLLLAEQADSVCRAPGEAAPIAR